MDYLLYIGFIISITAVFSALLIRPLKSAVTTSVVLLTAGLSCNLAFTLIQVSLLPNTIQLFAFSPAYVHLFRVDGLALFFLLVILTAAIPAVLAAHSYLLHYADRESAVRTFLVTFTILLISTQFLVLAQHAIVFLIFWELMTLMAYLGMLLEKEQKEVQKGSLIYFTVTHLATFSLYIFFFLLHNQSGSWQFSDFHISPTVGMTFYAVCFFGLLGFGIKAGFMPFHFWLPWAHPIAPTILSAFLSGVIIKTGIYGIFRLIEFCTTLPAWIGIVMLGISIFSAIFGVWYALAQHDIKKLLAYHSIENIGIIGIGIGLGLLGIAYSIPPLVWLGFGGALFHTLNHAIFKSLLFLGSGVVYQNLHTRDIERMGGIVNKAPWFVALFLIGSVAISGIPPLNGFMSEFLIYTGFFESASVLGKYFPLFMLVMTVGLAFVGGLALACFTKINSIMFLGTERTENRLFNVSPVEYVSLGILAALCILFGMYPRSALGIISLVISSHQWGIKTQPYMMAAQWNVFTAVFGSVVLTIGAIVVWKNIHKQKRISSAWACGYPSITPRMQYTASSYANEINTIASTVLRINEHVLLPTTIFPKNSRYKSHAEDFSEKKFIEPIYYYLMKKIASIEFLSRTDVRLYVSFMLLAVIIYGGIALIWTFF